MEWLSTLLDDIKASPGIMKLLERDDPDSLAECLSEVKELIQDGKEVIRMMMDLEDDRDPTEYTPPSVYPSDPNRKPPELWADEEGNIPF